MNTIGAEIQVVAQPSANPHVIRELPVLVLLPHSRCNCRCVMCDIWRIRQVREITVADLEPHRESFRQLGVRWVVFSGGEPLLHSGLFTLSRWISSQGIRTTLLTAGLTLERHAREVAAEIDDVIVSLDGPREVHDRIRGVPEVFGRLQRGIDALRACRPGMPIGARCTVQKLNFRHLRATAQAALDLALDSISFLAADDSSDAFNHSNSRGELPAPFALNSADVEDLAGEVDGLIEDSLQRLPDGFVKESPGKLRSIAEHLRARLGQIPHHAPRCNAPWVSAVIESDGSVRPCFFHAPIGNLRDGTLTDVLNGDVGLRFRSRLDISRDPICQSCVCSLHLTPGHAATNLASSHRDTVLPES